MALQRLEIKNPVGVNRSLEAETLPPGVWTDVRNVSFNNGKSRKAQGHESVFGTPPANILTLLPNVIDKVPYWFEATADKIYRTEGSVHTDVSRLAGGPYTATETKRWNGGVLNQVVVLNNETNFPQALLPSASNFVNLANWPANTTCKILRPFKSYLVALNVTKTSVNYPTLVKWSSPADPGQVPSTWDETDPTNDAGENPLADTYGAIVDGRKLKDTFIIYKEDSVYSMRYVGGVFVFQFQQLFDDVGMIAANCVAEFDGSHFVVSWNDVYVHNGVQKKSVIEGHMREYLYSTLRIDANDRTFVVPDYSNTEMWICYVSTDNTTDNYCDRALIWNWEENTWTIRDLPKVICGTVGIVDPKASDAWDDDPQSWDSDTTLWGDGNYNPAKTKLLFSSPATDKLYVIGSSSLFDTSAFTSRLEKVDMSFGDDHGMKFISSVTPHITGNGTLNAYVGTSNIQGGPVLWRGPFTFNIGQDYKIDCRVNGRYAAVKFEFSSTGNWNLSGYTLEFAPAPGSR